MIEDVFINATPDWIGILIAAVLYLVIGAIWYSDFLFGPLSKELSFQEKGDNRGVLSLFAQFLLAWVTAFFIDFFQRHLLITTVSDGMFVAFCFWLGFVAPSQLSSLLWGRGSWKRFMIHGGYRLLSYLAMGGLIAS